MMPQKSIAGIADAKLQVTNNTDLDFDQLARLLHAACADRRTRIPLPDLAQAAGMAERRVRNLGGIAQALGLSNRVTYRPTALGELVQKHDPFFDDTGTLWFLHYRISSEPRHLIWNRLVTQVIPAQRRLTRQQARQAFDDLKLYVSANTMKDHVPDEIGRCLDAYISHRFNRLAYLRMEDDAYALSYREPVPPLVLAAAITCFRDRHRCADTAVAIAELTTDRNGPGVVFQMEEAPLRASLENLKLEQGLSLESRADLDQVRLAGDMPDYAWMERYYAQR